jgi:radical SAM-linked protein
VTRRVPSGPPPPPTIAKVWLRYAKRGRLRFSSHRDFARAFERALRRAEVPMAYSAGFSPHPKISYVGAAPTGVASEAEYLEIGLAAAMDLDTLRDRLDRALPDGLDIIAAVASPGGSLAERIEASRWRITLSGVSPEELARAVAEFRARSSVPVERLTRDGKRSVDARGPVLSITISPPEPADEPDGGSHAILELVVRQASPAVRPDDVLAALRAVAGLALAAPPRAVRLAQGPLDRSGSVGDPLAKSSPAIDSAGAGSLPVS